MMKRKLPASAEHLLHAEPMDLTCLPYITYKSATEHTITLYFLGQENEPRGVS